MSTRIETCQGRLTVYFENPFWVGVFERIEKGKLSATKVTFGAEPKDYEVQEFINRHYYHLKFSSAIETDVKDIKKNPKRAQRDAKKQTLENGIGTKSQQALKLQQEQNKLVRKEQSRKVREAESDRLYELKQQKKKDLKNYLLKMIELYCYQEGGKDVWHDGRFIDRWADDWILEKLGLCFAHYEKSDIRNALFNTHDFFRNLATMIAEKNGFEYPLKAETTAKEYIKGNRENENNQLF